jgi:hypothetical protein
MQKLTYRGQTYTRSNHITSVNPQSTFTYRGQTYQRHTTTIAATPKANLVYRGVPYVPSEASEIAMMMEFERHQIPLSCPLLT